MKFVTFQNGGRDAEGAGPRPGVLQKDGTIVDLSGAYSSMLEVIRGGDAALVAVRRIVAESQDRVTVFRLLAPLPVPEQLRDCMAFERHLIQATKQVVRMKVGPLAAVVNGLKLIRVPKVWYRQPIYYKCTRFSVVGPDTDIVWPSYSQLMDYELELACVIGKRGKDIPKSQAAEYIFGYTIYNDFSARDAQFDEMDGRLGPAKGKDFDGGNVLGPVIVTPDEVGDVYNLAMQARVNGEERGGGNSGEMYFRFEDLIEHISRSETLHPGEIIGSGTVGNGCGLESGRFLQPNDVVELTIEGLGTLKNRVVRQA